MPITEQETVNTYIGNGIALTFPYGFKITEAADLKVELDGELKTLTTDYTLTGIGGAGGGNVVCVSAPASGVIVTLYRDMEYKRTTDYVYNGDLLEETVDADMDRIVMLTQQLRNDVKRSVKLPVNETTDIVLPDAASRASKYFIFDGSGVPGVGVGSASTPVSISMEAVLAAASRLAAYALLTEGQLYDIVLHYDADNTGVISCHSNVRQAWAELIAEAVTDALSVGFGSASPLYFPKGKYLVSAYLTQDTAGQVNYTKFIGDDSILVLASGVIAFGGIGSQTSFKGLIFKTGAIAISIKTGNNNTAIVKVRDCEFHNQTVASITMDGNSASTLVIIEGSKFFNTAGGLIARFITGDKVFFLNCWIEFQTPTAFEVGQLKGNRSSINTTFDATSVTDSSAWSLTNVAQGDVVITSDWLSWGVVSSISANKINVASWLGAGQPTNGTQVKVRNAGAVVHCQNIIGVPEGTATSWFDFYGGELNINDFRFGGEPTDAPISAVRCYAECHAGGNDQYILPTRLSIQNSSVYGAAAYVVKFYGLPNVFIFKNNTGMIESQGFYFDSGITNEEFYNFQRFGSIDISGNQGEQINEEYNFTDANGRLGHKIFTAMQAKLNNLESSIPVGPSGRITPDMLAGSGKNNGTGWVRSGALVTGAYEDDVYGVSQSKITATADGGYFTDYRNDFLVESALAAHEIYTLSVVVDATLFNRPLLIQIDIGGAFKIYRLKNGRQVLNLPFVYMNNTGGANAVYDKIAFQAYNMDNTSVIKYGRIILFKGIVNYQNDTLIMSVATGVSPAAITEGITADCHVGYFKGDIAYHYDVAASGTLGKVCTTAGDAGTWKTFGSVSA
ncbi:MAG: hypothetical protein A2Z02_07315 [Chloroflexi bacterium RBG_16_48_7]|nr:MAG: hypothetical protein A2Z02_07315 [Chloroflexi bacterium RBG_16_48_7]